MPSSIERTCAVSSETVDGLIAVLNIHQLRWENPWQGNVQIYSVIDYFCERRKTRKGKKLYRHLYRIKQLYIAPYIAIRKAVILLVYTCIPQRTCRDGGIEAGSLRSPFFIKCTCYFFSRSALSMMKVKIIRLLRWKKMHRSGTRTRDLRRRSRAGSHRIYRATATIYSYIGYAPWSNSGRDNMRNTTARASNASPRGRHRTYISLDCN